MPIGKKNEASNAVVPLIHFDEVAAERESFKLSWTVLANLRDYAAYVSDVTGRETTPDEVVDKGMQRLFDADKGFRGWLQQKKNEGRKQAKPMKTEKPSLEGRANATTDVLPKHSS